MVELMRRGERGDLKNVRHRIQGAQAQYRIFFLPMQSSLAIVLYRNSTRMASQRPVYSHRLPTNSPLFRAVTFIESHYGQTISVADIAHVACLSRSRLNQLFNETEGQSISRYLMNTRMMHAVEILAETDAPLTEIAEGCGFSEAAYFSRVFKSWFNVSPSRYRRGHHRRKI